ncbi:MAG: hypothetical protein EXS59_00560 [Candidatus Taylorbacteria bacterium]|nr:hypothetical protein [Candidatus Taylorbacteria bacterium]
MRVRFIVDRLVGTVVAEPCDPDTTLERSRIGQDILSRETCVAAISSVEFEPVKLVNEELLRALADAFAHGQGFEKELRIAITTVSDPTLR